VKRENIESSAGILLKVGPEIVGVMLINYRRPHHSFDHDEQIIISTLAFLVAIAIQNQRLLETFIKAGDYLITIPDLQQLLELIVQWAVQITHATHADLGEIYVLDSDGQELLMRARYPTSAPDSSYAPIAVGQGIIGWVAEHGQSFLSGDITGDPRCDSAASGIRSQLCVPLLDGGGHVLGVLTVLSPQPQAFTSDHQERLKALANSAVIAIQNARHEEQRRKEKTVAAMSDFGANFAHRVSNLWGTVPINFQAVKEAIAGENKVLLTCQCQIRIKSSRTRHFS
jgi:GAF domain-containing protein